MTTRDEYLGHKHRVYRGFVKLHAAVDVCTGAVVAATATDGRKRDAGQLPSLVQEASTKLDGRVTIVLAAGMYDSRTNFDLLDERGIEAVVRIRRNANMKQRGG